MGSTLRHCLKDLFGGFSVTVPRGPLAGCKWCVGAGLRQCRGTYEPRTAEAFVDSLTPGYTVFDVGAHMGYFTVATARLVGSGGRVVAFEPRPSNLRYLLRHIKVNRLANVQVVPSCVTDYVGECRFNTETGSGTGHISERGELSVSCTTIDSFVYGNGGGMPDMIKVDVEGAEYLVLEGARRVIETSRPKLLIGLHGQNLFQKCEAWLAQVGYTTTVVNEGRDLEILALPRDRGEDPR